MEIILVIVALVISIITLSVTWKKSDFDNGNLHAVFVVIALVLLCGSGLFFLFGTTTAISQIVNPQYYDWRYGEAFKQITRGSTATIHRRFGPAGYRRF